MAIKPEHELIVGATAIALVVATFDHGTPNVADVRADRQGNVNTYKATKNSAITATALIGSLSLLAQSPTVFIVGGITILLESWRMHFANYGVNGTDENQANGF